MQTIQLQRRLQVDLVATGQRSIMAGVVDY